MHGKLSKTLAMLLCLVMTASVVMSCAGGNKDEGGNAATPTPATSGSNDSSGGKTDTDSGEKDTDTGSAQKSTAEMSDYEKMQNTEYEMLWYFFGTDDAYPGTPDVEAEFNRILDEEYGAPGLKMRIKRVDWGDYGQKLNTMIMAGEQIDLLHATSWTVDPIRARESGQLMSWDHMMRVVPGFYEMWEPYIDRMLEPGPAPDFARKIWQMPTPKEWGELRGLNFNKTVAEELGLLDKMLKVKTWADLEECMDVYIAAYPDKGCFKSMTGSNLDWTEDGRKAYGLHPNWPYYNNAEDRYEIQIETPDFINYMNGMIRWREKGYINTFQDTIPHEEFTDYGFFAGHEWTKPGGAADWNAGNAATLGWEMEYTPIGKASMARDAIRGVAMHVASTSKNPDASMFVYMLVLMSPELTNLLNFGIEGVHYTKNSDQQMIRTEPNPEQDPYFHNMWFLGNRMTIYRFPGQFEDVGPLYDELNKTAIILGNSGFWLPGELYWPDGSVYDKSPVDAARGNLEAQYSNALYTGRMDTKLYEEYKQKFYDGGMAAEVEIYQIYYEYFKKARDAGRIDEWPAYPLDEMGIPYPKED